MLRTPRLIASLAFASAVLAGCTPSPPPAPSPSGHDAPRFASDEEALAAAEKAYGAYMEMVDTILRDGGKDPERLMALASAPLYAREAAAFEAMSENGRRAVGQRTFTLILQSYDQGEIIVYSCDDLTELGMVDAQGVSLVAPDRPDQYAFEVSIGVTESSLIVNAKDVWDGGGVC